MPRTNYQLLTPQNANELVAALNSRKRGRIGEVSFAMRAGMVWFAAALSCDYDHAQKEVRCIFNGNKAMTTVFPVSSPAILRRGEPSLEGGYPPPDIGQGEHETRWGVSVHGDLQIYCSQVVKDDDLLVVWTDWRSFVPGGEKDSKPLSDRLDVNMFGQICPRV